jgi:cytidylate kinase
MPITVLTPAVENRIAAMVELFRRERMDTAAKKRPPGPTITLSRQFGCEAYPLANRLKSLMEEKTGAMWTILDKALLEEMARSRDVSEIVALGGWEKPRFLDDFFATFSPRWKTEKDHFRRLTTDIATLAAHGNAIIVGRGAAIITQSLSNCYHFRISGTLEFRIGSIAKRLGCTHAEAAETVAREEKRRDKFILDFLDSDANDLSFYHLVFNNDKNTVEQMARTIAGYLDR